jgi:hypothetical protein
MGPSPHQFAAQEGRGFWRGRLVEEGGGRCLLEAPVTGT